MILSYRFHVFAVWIYYILVHHDFCTSLFYQVKDGKIEQFKNYVL